MTFVDPQPSAIGPPRLDLPDLFQPIVASTTDGVPTLRILVGGEWQTAETGEDFAVRSPIDGTLIARAQRGGKGDVERAIAAATAARDDFLAVPAAERLRICEDAAQVMAGSRSAFQHTITIDLGKTATSADSEAGTTIERLDLVREEVRKIFGEYIPGDWIPGTIGKRGVVLREPLGTVAAIGPFNYPLFIPASKIIPALAAGNTVVAKAPSDAPTALLMFARVLEEAGLPEGALNVVTGPGSELGDALASHPDISMISFTGSSTAGRALARAAGPKPIHLELGGNGAGIVLSDADVDDAAAKTVAGAFKLAGQRCSGLSRILVEEAVYDDYVERALGEAQTWTAGDPRADGVGIGPLVNAEACETVHGLVQDALDKGAELLAGGETDEAYHQPTVLAAVPLDADIVWEETFGPVLTIVKVGDEDAAIEVANRSRYGLDSAVFTSDLDRAWRVAGALEVGMVTVNDAPSHGVGHFPFGGRTPDSGVGREGLGYSIDECTALKTVVLP
ncbi:MAG: aldehyde dehydrogenase family protein, partial [Actinomycetota bacterium]|nr:aldehyde dehydrogenase family protein [Actinomycetota bacterium]